MKRRFLTVLLTLITTLCLAFGLTACDIFGNSDDGGPNNTEQSGTQQGGSQLPDKDDDDKTGPDDTRSDPDNDANGDEGKEPDVSDDDDKEPDGDNDDKEPDIDDKDPDVDEKPTDHVHTFTVKNVCSECGAKWEYSEWLEYELDPETDTYTVTAVADPASGNIVIPYGYQGKWVTKIGDAAFAYRTAEGYCPAQQIRTITIPDSVTSIGESAFDGCSGLTHVTIPDNMTSIAKYMFYNCRGLTEIQFIGTIQEWALMQKGYCWDSYTGNYTVICTDGTIDKSGNVTYFEQ